MGTYEEHLKLLEKFKPPLLVRILWWFNQTIRNETHSTLQYNVINLYKNCPVESDFIKAYYAQKEIDRRAREQKAFIEKLEKQ